MYDEGACIIYHAAGTPSVPPKPSTPRLANEAGCTNKAMFVADVTIPDNTGIGAGETFTKTWRISNAGTCVWAWDYNLSYYSENRMGAPEVVPLDITYPGQTLDISVELTAPGSPGTYRGNFVIKNAEGLIMQVDEDSRLWLIIKVENTAPAATAAPTTNISLHQHQHGKYHKRLGNGRRDLLLRNRCLPIDRCNRSDQYLSDTERSAEFV